MIENRNYVHYLILIIGIFVFSLLFIYFRYNVSAQIIVAAMGSSYYILWGIFHHAVLERLTDFIALEYALIGSFVFLILYLAISL